MDKKIRECDYQEVHINENSPCGTTTYLLLFIVRDQQMGSFHCLIMDEFVLRAKLMQTPLIDRLLQPVR